jgi:signal transduction histidine kinase
MRRPWYSYILVTIGILAVLWAFFRPPSSVGGSGPGAVVRGPRKRVTRVWAGSALAAAGLRPGDLFLSADTIRRSDFGGELIWKGDPLAGKVQIQRLGYQLEIYVYPVRPALGVRLVWIVLKLLNLALVALALALFWQRPRDGRAVLLGLTLLAAPVFAAAPGARLWALALSAHFFAVFPTGTDATRRRRVLGIYGGCFLAVLVGGILSEHLAGLLVYHAAALALAGYSMVRVQSRWQELGPEGAPVVRTLTWAAGAILGAVLLGLLQLPWETTSASPLATLIPAAVFSAAVGHLVFRVRALEVEVMAHRTIQYLLARWTLGALFLIPGFLLVYTIGVQNGAHQSGGSAAIPAYIVWMIVMGLLLASRTRVLRNLDRRFFRDIEEARQTLIRLAQELAGLPTWESVFQALERGVTVALHPRILAFGTTPNAPAGTVMSIPIQRGSAVYGFMHLGPKETGTEYSAEERSLLEAAGVQAAMALENVRLSAALLEQQRTELTARTAGVLAGAEEERRRLAGDLHDQVLPELRQIAGEFERLKSHANGMEPDLDRLEGEVRATMDSVREVMEALRPSALDMLGLGYALESYFRKGAERRRPPLTVSVRHIGPETELTPEQSLGLYRICQEAINNVLKHSGADRAGLEVAHSRDELRLSVWDNGRGLDPRQAESQGYGLSNIRYRADLIGAKVEWSTLDEGGTRFDVRLSPGVAAGALQE